jgi:hypothetical protein
MKAPSDERLPRNQRQGIILGFTVVFFAGATLIFERDKLHTAFERNFSIEKKEAKSGKKISEEQVADIPICQ